MHSWQLVNYTSNNLSISEKVKDLENFVSTYSSAVIAYSGGIDSSLVANISTKVLGKNKTLVVIAVSPSLNNNEYKQALELAKKYDWNFKPIFTEEFNNDNYLKNGDWKKICDEAFRMAYANLESKPSPAGEMKVVLGPGWPAILIHEAVGHGLEGDFNRIKTSVFHDLVGKKVASDGVTIIDDGTIDKRRGSLNIDDEGTPTEKTVLIENGILKNFMQDRLNARLMKTRSTGSGRRENYRHIVLPRMRNTMMLNGNRTQDEMIKSVDRGIFAVSFGGGQVDITSGKFVFNCTEAYEIINGKIGAPLKGATLIGDGPSSLKEVAMVGNDMMLDPGIGTCGKAGQGVPVGVGQPSLLINKMTVGGTQIR